MLKYKTSKIFSYWVAILITLSWTQAAEDENIPPYRGGPRLNCLQLSMPIFDGKKINREQRTYELKAQLKAQKEKMLRQKFMLEEQVKILQTCNKLADDDVAIFRNKEASVSSLTKLLEHIDKKIKYLPNVIYAPLSDDATIRIFNLVDSFTWVHSCFVCKQWYVLGHLVRFSKIEEELSYLLKGIKKALDDGRLKLPDYWRYSDGILSDSIRCKANLFIQVQEWGLMGWYMESAKLYPIIQAGD